MNEHLLTPRVLNLPRTFALRFWDGSLDLYEELVGEGMLGLAQAARDYDPNHPPVRGDKPASFQTYAFWVVWTHVRDAHRRERKTFKARCRRKNHSILDYSEKLFRDDERLSRTELKEYVRDLVRLLPPKERKIPRLVLRGKSFHEVAEKVGLSKRAVLYRLRGLAGKLRKEAP